MARSDAVKSFTALHLSFASKDDIKTMDSDSARFVNAALVGDKASVKAFIKESNKEQGKSAGVNIDCTDFDGMTPLIAAASGGNLDVVKLLVKAGADVNASDKDKMTAGESSSGARSGGVKRAERQMQQSDAHWARRGSASFWRSLPANAALTRPFSASPLFLWSVWGANTALFLPVMEGSVRGHYYVVKYLIENGADINSTGVTGVNAAWLAAGEGRLDVLKYLIGKEGDVHVTRNDGITALQVRRASEAAKERGGRCERARRVRQAKNDCPKTPTHTRGNKGQ